MRRPFSGVVATGLAVSTALLAALFLVSTWDSGSSSALTPAGSVGSFLHRFVSSDGRVVRRDQGGDTVSEGQAYAMLMAAAIGNRRVFDSVWTWSERNLLQPDGLLAWHWTDGSVADTQSASDADVGAATALAMAAHRFGDPAYMAEGRSLAHAVAAHEVGTSAAGPTLVAGAWAMPPPEYVDPSYLDPNDFSELAASYGSPWGSVERVAEGQLLALSSGPALPPDWAVIGSDGHIHPSAPPGSPGQSPSFGYDAVRVPIWMATACSVPLRTAAAKLAPSLDRANGQGALDDIARAAAEWATGAHGSAWQALRSAARTNQPHPTYYTTALIALTTLSFDHLLASC